MNRRILGIYLLAIMAALTLPAAARSHEKQEVDPDTLRILWADEAHQWPEFIPQAVIGDLDLTSPETVDLSHLPLTESQRYSFKYFLFAEPRGSRDCFKLPIIELIVRKEDLKLSTLALLAKERLVTTGVVRKIIPGWEIGFEMPAKMIFVEVVEVLRDLSQVAIPGELLVFIQISGGELVISGKRLCSEHTGDFEATVGDEVLLLGSRNSSDADYIGGQVFWIQDSLISPNPDYGFSHRKEAEPIPFWKLQEEIQKLAELER